MTIGVSETLRTRDVLPYRPRLEKILGTAALPELLLEHVQRKIHDVGFRGTVSKLLPPTST